MPLRVIPVLDLQDGRAVRAIAGDRAHYRPVRSLLQPGSDPVGLARAYRDALGLTELYLADLDAIGGAPPDVAFYREIRTLGTSLWVDAGIRGAASLPPLLDSEVDTIVVGLESLRGPGALAEILDEVPPERLVFSLDCRGGVPQTAPDSGWATSDPAEIAGTAFDLGLRRFLLLDLARVGTGRGTGTLSLLARLAADFPEAELTVGGGIAGPEDFAALRDAGASSLLIGSALHDGRIGKGDWA